MFRDGKTGGLTASEKKVVKRLLVDGSTNQDVQARINFGRPATVNFSRISSVKADKNQKPASDQEMGEFSRFKTAYDPKTGLNKFIDERLVKSRDAMKLAVSVFNNPSIEFKTESFLVLANIAWTYLAIEYAARNGMETERKNGKAISISDFIDSENAPFSVGVKNNLETLIKLRNLVEHRLLGEEDPNWVTMFQANCVNYERFLTAEFGERLSLSQELAFALQFSSLSIGQAESMAKSETSTVVKSINKNLLEGLTDDQKQDQEFRFSVVYTTVSTSKSKAAFNFIAPDSKEGCEIANVLVKNKPSAETHPFLAKEVVRKVKQTGKAFSMSGHTKAWKTHNVRPATNSAKPSETNTDYCYYNPTYKRYSYNQKWVGLLCGES